MSPLRLQIHARVSFPKVRPVRIRLHIEAQQAAVGVNVLVLDQPSRPVRLIRADQALHRVEPVDVHWPTLVSLQLPAIDLPQDLNVVPIVGRRPVSLDAGCAVARSQDRAGIADGFADRQPELPGPFVDEFAGHELVVDAELFGDGADDDEMSVWKWPQPRQRYRSGQSFPSATALAGSAHLP